MTPWHIVDPSGLLQNSLILQETLYFGNSWQHKTILLYHLLLDENPQAASDVKWTEHEKASVSHMRRTTRFWPSVEVNMIRVGENRRWPAPHCLPYWCLDYHATCGISSLIINNCDSWHFLWPRSYAIYYLAQFTCINSFQPHDTSETLLLLLYTNNSENIKSNNKNNNNDVNYELLNN